MVAYLEKSTENTDFAEITNFLNANPIRKTKRKATKISQSSGPTTLVADENIHEERGDRVERAAANASSLEVEQDSGTINRTQSTEDASNQERNVQDEEISFVQEDTEIQGSAPVTTADLYENEKCEIKEKSKEKGVSSIRLTRGVIMKEASKTASRPTIPPQQQLDPKDKGKEKGIDIYMLVEKEYLLSRETLTLMLVAKLLADQDNEMSKELIRKIFMEAERPRR
nr:hypothetical protein [Tanacetum cinerariifolium]